MSCSTFLWSNLDSIYYIVPEVGPTEVLRLEIDEPSEGLTLMEVPNPHTQLWEGQTLWELLYIPVPFRNTLAHGR